MGMYQVAPLMPRTGGLEVNHSFLNFNFMVVMSSIQDLSSLTRDRTCTPQTESMES